MSHVAFSGPEQVAIGTERDVALAAQRLAIERPGQAVLIFDAEGRPVDFDLSGGPADLTARFAPAVVEDVAPRGRGRPKLGVVPREVTLLPRHWDWLAGQPGGASVALRKLVEAARRDSEGPDRIRRSREAAYRFASAMAGDLPGFEAAMRALFAGEASAFESRIVVWPADIAGHLRRLAAGAFGVEGPEV